MSFGWRVPGGRTLAMSRGSRRCHGEHVPLLCPGLRGHPQWARGAVPWGAPIQASVGETQFVSKRIVKHVESGEGSAGRQAPGVRDAHGSTQTTAPDTPSIAAPGRGCSAQGCTAETPPQGSGCCCCPLLEKKKRRKMLPYCRQTSGCSCVEQDRAQGFLGAGVSRASHFPPQQQLGTYQVLGSRCHQLCPSCSHRHPGSGVTGTTTTELGAQQQNSLLGGIVRFISEPALLCFATPSQDTVNRPWQDP